MGVLSYVIYLIEKVPVYIAEITPKNLRGGFTTVHQLMICCGVSVTYLIGASVSWRVLAPIGTIPGLIQLLGLFFIPESPRGLAKIGRWEECEALQKTRGERANISVEAAEIRDYTEALQRHSEASIFELFRWKSLQLELVWAVFLLHYLSRCRTFINGLKSLPFWLSSVYW